MIDKEKERAAVAALPLHEQLRPIILKAGARAGVVGAFTLTGIAFALFILYEMGSALLSGLKP